MPVKHPVSMDLQPHILPAMNISERDVSSANSKAIRAKPSLVSKGVSYLSGKADDAAHGAVQSLRKIPGLQNVSQPRWLIDTLWRGMGAAEESRKSKIQDIQGSYGITPGTINTITMNHLLQSQARDRHNSTFSKESAVEDFVDYLRKEASMDYKTKQQLASAKKIHNVPDPAPRDKTNRFGQYGGYDWSNYNPTADSSAPKDLSGRGGYKSLAGGWEPTRYMDEINAGRQRLLDNKHGMPDNEGYLRSLGVTPVAQTPASAPKTTYPAVGSQSAPSPAAGGALGGAPAAVQQSYPQPGTPEYDEAVSLRARGSDDYRAARNGEGRMGFLPDGSWGLVTPEMEGQPIQRTQPQHVAAPVTAPVTPPVREPIPTPGSTAGPSEPIPTPGSTTGPNQHNNVPPDPFSTDPFENPGIAPDLTGPSIDNQWGRPGSVGRAPSPATPFKRPGPYDTGNHLAQILQMLQGGGRSLDPWAHLYG